MPYRRLKVSFPSHSLYIGIILLNSSYDHPDCTVQLLEGDDVVFEVPFFPYTANNINLPAALSGQYELRIVEVGYYFSAVIELE